MKPFVYVLLAFVSLTACSSEETAQPKTVEGIWNLASLTGGFAGVDFQYSAGEVTFDFNAKDSTVVVNNNLSEDDIRKGFVLSEGQYIYWLEYNDDRIDMYVDQHLFGTVRESSIFFLLVDDEALIDGFSYSFMK